jgi:hypothetical protein
VGMALHAQEHPEAWRPRRPTLASTDLVALQMRLCSPYGRARLISVHRPSTVRFQDGERCLA